MTHPNSSGEGRGASLALRRFAALPAVRALAIQLACVPATLAIIYAAARLGAAPGYVHVALVQAILAALGTVRARLARWWRLIQPAFPLTVFGASALDLPPWIFLAAFLLFVVLFWSTFRTQVPYYPSGRAVRTAVAGLLRTDAPPRMIDIGCGFGGLVLQLARERPDATVEGIELAPLPWLVCRLRAAVAHSRARFLRGDYEDLDFGDYDLVFAYLSPAVMGGLWHKAQREMRPGAVLASYEFAPPGRVPDRVLCPGGGRRSLYIWQF